MDPSTSESCSPTGRTDYPVAAARRQENNDLGSKSPSMQQKPGRIGLGGPQASIDSGYKSNGTTPSTHPSSLDPTSPDLSTTASIIKPFQRIGENAIVYLTEDSGKDENESSGTGTELKDTAVSSNDIPANLWPHQAVDKDVESSSSMVVGKSREGRKDSTASITSGGSEGTRGDGDVQRNETLVKQQQHQIGALQNSLRRETSEREVLQKQVTKVTKEKESLEFELANVQRNFESEVQKLEGQLQEKTKELEKCQKQLAERELKLEQMRIEHTETLSQEKAKAEEEISRIHRENNNKIKELQHDQAKTEKQKLQIEIVLWQTRQENEAKISNLKLQLKDKEMELLQTEVDLERKQKEVAEKESTITKLQAKLDMEEMKKECEILRRNSADKDARIAILERRLSIQDTDGSG